MKCFFVSLIFISSFCFQPLWADCAQFLTDVDSKLRAGSMGDASRIDMDQLSFAERDLLVDLTLNLLTKPAESDWLKAKSSFPDFSLLAWKHHFESMAASLNTHIPGALSQWLTQEMEAEASARAEPIAPAPAPVVEVAKAEPEPQVIPSFSRQEYENDLKTKLPEQIAIERNIPLSKVYEDLIFYRLTPLHALATPPSRDELSGLSAILQRANPHAQAFANILHPDFSRAHILEALYDEHGLDPAQLAPHLGLSSELFELYRRATNLGSVRRDTTWMRSFRDRWGRSITVEEFLRESLGLGLTAEETAKRFAQQGLVFTADQIQSRWRTLGLVDVVSNSRTGRSLGLDILDREKRQAFVSAHVIAFFRRTGRLPEATDFVALDGSELKVGETSFDDFSIVDYEKDGRPIVPFNYNAFAAPFATEGNSTEGFRQAWIRAKRDSVLLAEQFQIDPLQFRVSDHEFRIPLNEELRRIRKEEMADRILEALIVREGEWPLMAQWHSVFGMAPQKIIATDMYAAGGAAHEHRIFDNRFDMLVEIQKANERRTARVGEENAFSFDRLRNRAIARNSEFVSIFQLETLQGLLQQLAKRESLEPHSLLQQGTIDRTLFAPSNFQDLEILIALDQAYRAQPEKFAFLDRESFEGQLEAEIERLRRLKARFDQYVLDPNADLSEMPQTAESLAELTEWRARVEADTALTAQVRQSVVSRLDAEMKKRENILAQDAEITRVVEKIISSRSLSIEDFKTDLFPSRLEALEALRDRIRTAPGFLGRARPTRLSELEAVITQEIEVSVRALEGTAQPVEVSPAAEAPKQHFDGLIRQIIESSSLPSDFVSSEGFETRLQALQQLRQEILEARGFRGRSRQSRLNELDAWIADEQVVEASLVDLQRRRKLPTESLPQLEGRTYRESLDLFRRSLSADTRLTPEKRNRFLQELDAHIQETEERAIEIHMTFMMQTGRVISSQSALVGYADIMPSYEALLGAFRSEREMLEKVFARYRSRPTIIRNLERRRSVEAQFRALGFE